MLSFKDFTMKNVETLGIEPKLTIRKIVVLPFKLYPLRVPYIHYPRNDLNVHDLHQQSLKLSCLPIPALGFTTITFKLAIKVNQEIAVFKARVIRTPN
jgi:hypothetical protein